MSFIIPYTEATFAAVKELIDESDYEDEYDRDAPDMDEIHAICECFGRDDVHRSLLSVIKGSDILVDGDYEYALYECIEMEYPAGARKIVDIFEKWVQPKIKDLVAEENLRIYRVAHEALREKAEREKREQTKGCECCVDDNEFHVIKGCAKYSGVELSLNSHLGLLRVRSDCDSDVIYVNTCPICGKNLQGEKKDAGE